MTVRTTERAQVSAGIGDRLALEFANTAGWHLSGNPSERLVNWDDVVNWAAEHGLVGTDEAGALAQRQCPVEPVIRLRETVFRVGLAVARQDRPVGDDLEALVTAASATVTEAVWKDGRMQWRFGPGDPVKPMLAIVARDAVGLLSSDRVERLRVCEDETCGWLFLDDSRGRQRRWCSMLDCGNRAKARSAYLRQKAKREAQA